MQTSVEPRVDPLIGTLFAGRFQIESILGTGGMGRVYRAVQVSLGKRVAVKVLHRRLLGDERVQQRFHREARAASLLDRPNCIRILDFGRAEDGSLFIAMEYLEGKSLADLVREKGELTGPEIIEILMEVCIALEEAHGRGVLHRDLKPDNIYLTQMAIGKQLVKVLDFGIAKILDEEGRTAPLTTAGTICGTPEYMSPEHVQGKTVDERTDIYALGCILYQLLTGAPPFQGALVMDILTKQLSVQPTLPSERCPGRDIPPALEWLCMRALKKSPDERPASAVAFRQELQEALADLAASPPPSEGVMVSVPPPSDAVATAEDRALEIGLATTALVLLTPQEIRQVTVIDADVPKGTPRWWMFVGVAVFVVAVIGFVAIRRSNHEQPKPIAPIAQPPETLSLPIILPLPEAADAGKPHGAAVKTADTHVVRDVGPSKSSGSAPQSRRGRVTAILVRGRTLMAQGKTSDAIAVFEDALTGKDTNPEFHFELGRLYTRISKPEQARQHYEEYLRLTPNSMKRDLVESLLRAGK